MMGAPMMSAPRMMRKGAAECLDAEDCLANDMLEMNAENCLADDMLENAYAGVPSMMARCAPAMCDAPVAYASMPSSDLMGGGMGFSAGNGELPGSQPSESYQVVDMDLNLEQAKRMVKKSIAKTKSTFKK